MFAFRHPTLCALVALAGLWAAPACAQPVPVVAQPAQGSVAAAVTQITITFDGPVDAAQSGMELLMTAMPGMTHHEPMKMTGIKTSLTPDGKTLTARLPRPLMAGTYEAAWHVASGSGQRAAGKLGFSVK